MRSALIFGCVLALSLVPALSQEPPPMCASLEYPGFRYAPFGAIVLRIDSVCATSNAAVCSSGVRYQFWRHVISGRAEMEEVSPVVSADSFVFSGALDGEVFEYRARAVCGDDTSEWSDPLVITHDLESPTTVPFFDAAHCREGLDDSTLYVQLVWQRATDNASGVRGYAIYRSNSYSDLLYITPSTPDIAFIPNDGSEIYCFYDYDVEPDRYYYYAVVPYDSAGVPSLGRGHWPTTGNIIEAVYTAGPGFCCGSGGMLCAVLREIPNVLTTTSYTVEVNNDACHPCCGIMYQYRLVDLSTGDTLVSDWTAMPSYNWSPLEDCHSYIFSARALWEHDTTTWSDSPPKLCDLSGPGCVDSLTVTPIASTPDAPGALDVHFYVSNEAELDCGVGVAYYKLYRIEYPDGLDEFLPYDTSDTEHLLWTYHVGDTFGTNMDYEFCDDCPTDPDIDLSDEKTYMYIVVAFDSLGRWSWCGSNVDTGTVDKGIAPPMLLPLPVWHRCDSVVLRIVDTSFCDMTEIQIERALTPDFSVGYHLYGPFPVHDDILHNPDDSMCNDWDTLSFVIHFDELEETQYYFRAVAYDELGNISAPSNYVSTRFDCTPPLAVSPDSVKSVADSTGTVDIKVWWAPSNDAGVGIMEYDIYRSSSPGDMGSPVATVPHSPFITYYEWVDDNPNPANNFHDNYYTVVAVDSFGNASTTGATRGFADDTPPIPVRIDTVYTEYSEGEMWVVVEWSDTTPSDFGTGGFGNSYRLEHSADLSWLFTRDPLLINVEEPVFTHRIRLPRSIFTGSPNRYFHIATIDIWGNESGYSEPYFFYDSSWAADTAVLHLFAAWNLVSLPVLPRSLAFEDVFPTAGTPCVTFDAEAATFYPVDSLGIGWGYWIISYTDQDVGITGYHIPEYARVLPVGGWYLVGGVSDTADFAVVPDEARLMSQVVWWNPSTGSYEPSSELLPGRGYWILVGQPCTLFVPSGGRTLREREAACKWSFDITAGTQKLMLCVGSEGAVPMPPAPMTNSLPALIRNGQKLIRDATETGEWTLLLPHKAKVRWNPQALSGRRLLLIAGGEVDMSRTGEVVLPAGQYRIILASKPKRLAVSAKPNPFNASVELTLSVPDDGDARLEVISTDGKVVRVLWRGRLSFGAHRFTWDGTDAAGRPAAGGVYIVRATFEGEVASTRILLLK